MTDIQIRKNHTRQQGELRTVAEKLAGQLSLSGHWQSNCYLVHGKGFDASLELLENEIIVKARLGFFLRPMKEKIRAEIEQYLDKKL